MASDDVTPMKTMTMMTRLMSLLDSYSLVVIVGDDGVTMSYDGDDEMELVD